MKTFKQELSNLLFQYVSDNNSQEVQSLLSSIKPQLALELVNEKYPDGSTILHDVHSAEIAQYLIDLGANVNNKSQDGWTPLTKAAAWRKLEILSVLLTNKADVGTGSDEGSGALRCAIERTRLDAVKVIADFAPWCITDEMVSLSKDQRYQPYGQREKITDYLLSKMLSEKVEGPTEEAEGPAIYEPPALSRSPYSSDAPGIAGDHKHIDHSGD